VEVIAGFDRTSATRKSIEDADFLETLSRRPMTARDLAQIMGLPLSQVKKRLERLEADGLISHDLYLQEGFYRR
jgi:predicted ArsR family transcriptional regulator